MTATEAPSADADEWSNSLAENWYRDLYIPEFVFPKWGDKYTPLHVFGISAGLALIFITPLESAGRFPIFVGGHLLCAYFCFWAVRGSRVTLVWGYVLDPTRLRLFRPLRGRAWIFLAACLFVGLTSLHIGPPRRALIAVGGWFWGYGLIWLFLRWGERTESQ